MFCFHKFGEIKDGYQYCSKCGKAIPVKCNHDFQIIKQVNVYMNESDTIPSSIKYILRCSKCGKMKNHNP